MNLSIIVAVSENGVIGKDNQLIWRLSSDLKRFKALTMGHPIIMGRKTHESIGKALPGRQNIIISRNKEYTAEGCDVIHSPDAIQQLLKAGEKAFIIGGEEIYRIMLPYCNEVQLTKVHTNIEGDAFFELTDPASWIEEASEHHKSDEKNEYDYSFITLRKKA